MLSLQNLKIEFKLLTKQMNITMVGIDYTRTMVGTCNTL